MDKKIIIYFLILLLLVGASNAGERKTTRGNTLLNVGECDRGSGICVLAEKEIYDLVFQDVETRPYDGKCEFVVIFKKIIDPKRGVLYKYYATKNCRTEKTK